MARYPSVLGLQLATTTVLQVAPAAAVEQTGLILRMIAASGALVLVHNLYGQAAPSSRSNIRFAMLGLALSWAYDLNYYTLSYLDPRMSVGLAGWRGVAVALTAPLYALAARTRMTGGSGCPAPPHSSRSPSSGSAPILP